MSKARTNPSKEEPARSRKLTPMRESAPRASRAATGIDARWVETVGNQAWLRGLVTGGQESDSGLVATGSQRQLRAPPVTPSKSEEQEEAAADATADRVEPGGRPRSFRKTVDSPPDCVSVSTKRQIESNTGALVSSVNIHRNKAADRAARALGAFAFTRGKDISFSARAPALSSPEGRWLLAHEMSHVAQQDGDSPRLRLYPNPLETFRDPNSQVMSDVPGAIPGDAMDPTSGIEVDETIRVVAPLLDDRRRRGEDSDQTYHLHSAIISRIPISAYAVARGQVTLDEAGSIPAESRSGAPPEITAGTTVYGPRQVPLAALGADPANVIVESTGIVHYAVGAGSCVLVRTNGGWYLFDAGININEPNALADAIVEKIATRLNGESIRAVFLTHGHYDHVSLLSRLARRVQIDNIVANPLQFARDVYVRIREGMRTADLERRAAERARIEADTEARSAFVESLERRAGVEAINREDVQRAWRQEVASRVESMYPELRESTALPVRGSSGLEFETLGTRPLHSREAPEVRVEELLPRREGELRGVVDPDLRRRSSMREGEVDRMSTTYILTVDGRRLLILPDLRRTDITRIRRELQEALGGRRVEFQEWVAGHHMQIGWREGVVSARTLTRTLELLHGFRATGRGGSTGRDAVIASVDPAQVDAAQIRLLRLLGFETFLAHSQADVQTYDVLSRGRILRGIHGTLAPGARGEPTLRRSIAARASLLETVTELSMRRRSAGGRQERRELRDEIRAKRQTVRQFRALEERLIDAVRADPFNETAARSAETALNRALDAEGVGRVVTSSSQLTDTAMILLREPLGPEPEPGTPEAEQRARDVALRTRKSRVDMLRETARNASPAQRQAAYAELYAEMAQYEHLLAAESEGSRPGVTREVVEAELARIRTERTALEGSFRSGEAVRLPDGQLVENRLVRIEPPEATRGARVPSRTAQAMLQGLGWVGRGLGGVMVITTIRGSADLIDQYERGQANLAQLGIGAVRNATSGVVGLRMLRGARVGVGVFVVISVLDVGMAYAGDYDSETERRRAIGAAARDAAIHTGCLIAGEMLIATMNPIGIAAGAVIMFLGPAIIDLLFGDDPPESLYPDEVGEVDEVLVELLSEYRQVVGGLLLARRSTEERADIGLTEDISLDAEISVERHRARALYLESLILPAFEAAYERVRVSRAGLRDIDLMRSQFLSWRSRASTDETDEEGRNVLYAISQGLYDPRIAPLGFDLPEEFDDSGWPIPIRVQTLRRFQRMEEALSLDSMSPEQIRNLEQWSSIKRRSVELIRETMHVDPDWRDLAQRQHELEVRLANARYRLDPQSQNTLSQNLVRRVPLLAPGTAARAAYEAELTRAESFVFAAERFVVRTHWVNLRIEGIETPNIEALGTGGPRYGSMIEARLATADDAVDVYERTVREIGGPPEAVGGVEALYREPSARATYLEQLETNRPYRKMLLRLEVGGRRTALFDAKSKRSCALQPNLAHRRGGGLHSPRTPGRVA